MCTLAKCRFHKLALKGGGGEQNTPNCWAAVLQNGWTNKNVAFILYTEEHSKNKDRICSHMVQLSNLQKK